MFNDYISLNVELGTKISDYLEIGLLNPTVIAEMFILYLNHGLGSYPKCRMNLPIINQTIRRRTSICMYIYNGYFSRHDVIYSKRRWIHLMDQRMNDLLV